MQKKILLIGNYKYDYQKSMDRFINLLSENLTNSGYNVKVVRPFPILYNFLKRFQITSKWIAYIDKLVLFPIYIYIVKRQFNLIHICDHSNAFYIHFLNKNQCVVTCHDCLAIRAANNEFKEKVNISFTGKILQKYILSGLNSTKYIACVSENTKSNLKLILESNKLIIKTIYMGKSSKFIKKSCNNINEIHLNNLKTNFSTKKFILHVGNNNWYKNKSGVIDVYKKLHTKKEGVPKLIMAGAALKENDADEIKKNGLSEEILNLIDVSDDELCNLYNQAELLLFPSYEEGFGWPIIEAFSCGCRVVTSNRSSMLELGGEAALYGDPYDTDSFVEPILQILSETTDQKNARITLGFKQLEKFTNEKMTEKYIDLYADVLGEIK